MSMALRIGSLAVAALTVAAAAQADERIVDFRADIRVAADSSMLVTETLRVHAEGARIKHGILRDFPTRYHDAYGNPLSVDFEPLEATRDGHAERFRSEPFENGERVYFGDAATTVTTGEHEYTFRYRTARQLGFFADHDELYWNATGTGWNFPIDHASAAVTLPGAIAPDQLKLKAFTGPQGAKSRDYRASADAPSHAIFETTATLPARAGLTIAVGFPKGIVTPPRLPSFLTSAPVLAGLLGVIGVLIYYVLTWRRVGRDPRRAPVMPLYEPPAALSPATLRYVERRIYDDRCFAADVVDLAVHGALKIEQGADKTFVLSKLDGDRTAPASIERLLKNNLFDVSDRLPLDREHGMTVGMARAWHKSEIVKTCAKRHFNDNTGYFVLGAGLSLAALVVMNGLVGAADARGGADMLAAVLPNAMMTLFGILPTVLIAVLAQVCLRAWRNGTGFLRRLNAIVTTIVIVPLCLGLVAGAVFLFGGAQWFGAGAALALVVVNGVFFRLLPAPTAEGRQVLDQIAGLRLYLAVAEHDTIVAAKAPPATFEEFQRFLPYALALGVEKNWTDRFAAALGPAALATGLAATAWYVGDMSNFSTTSFSSFADDLGSSVAESIPASASSPGSSSAFGSDYGSSSSDSGGSSDSGSSGGGGGGGGGDGW